ncbi:hypothetical protein GF402_06820 [Candidatus Fermentibacteria bacterium]|nr:hypothetical protein [Candidatus Fermentibacteria bacterium]
MNSNRYGGLMLRFSLRLALAVAPLVPLLALPSPCSGYGYHDALGMGTPVPGSTALAIAEGGPLAVGMDGPSALFSNPAGLSLYDGALSVQASGGLLWWTEQVTGDTMTTVRTGNQLGNLALAVGFPLGDELIVSTGLAKVSTNSYFGSHDIPSEPYQPGDEDSIEVVESSGGLWEALAGVRMSLPRGFVGGLALGGRFGSTDYTYTKSSSVPGSGTGKTEYWEWSERELCVHGGLLAEGELGRIGISYVSGSDHYYSRLAVGVQFVAERIGNTVVGLEGELESPFDKNLVTGRYFLNVPLSSRIGMTGGLTLNQSETADKARAGFSFGGSVETMDTRMELGVSWQSNKRPGSTFESEAADYVDDSGLIFSLGLMRSL